MIILVYLSILSVLISYQTFKRFLMHTNKNPSQYEMAKKASSRSKEREKV